MLQYDVLRNRCFPCRALRNLQHRWGRIQQRNVHAKTRQANRRRSRAGSDVQRTQ
jgi:hypothetical protein